MFHATPPHDVSKNSHQSSYFFVVAPQRRRVSLIFFTPSRSLIWVDRSPISSTIPSCPLATIRWPTL
jgi:hypothetical protein